MRSPERGARVRFPPPLVFLLAIGAGFGLARAAGPARAPLGPHLRLVVGSAVILCALLLVASARTLFFRTRQSPTPWSPTPSLIVTGPYRFTRNPMYVGITLFLVGLAVVTDNLWIALCAPLALAVVHVIAVRPEERYLAARFGPPYAEYRARVRRYL
jgi:protein-S-isoprenylcysteine O-methyltransferase Ste14